MNDLVSDLRLAGRGLLRSPGFTLAAALILALGIGANAAIFSLVDAVLFRPLPVHEPERLARVFASSNEFQDLSSTSLPVYRELREDARSFSSLAAYTSGNAVHISADQSIPLRVPAALTSSNYFETLGVVPVAGRSFLPGEEQPGSAAVAVLGHRLAARLFSSAEAAVGRSITINQQPVTVVGIAPPGFWGTNFDEPAEVWVPLPGMNVVLPQFSGSIDPESRGFSFLDIIGRLAPGADLRQAEAEATTIAGRNALGDGGRASFALRPAAEVAGGTTVRADVMRTMSWVLLGVVATVFFIACADVAALLLLRGERRRHEIAIRLAMGIPRPRLVRQLLVESLLLAFGSAALSLLLAVSCVKAFIAALPPDSPFPFELSAQVLDGRVLAATAATALVAGLLLGLLPALHLTRPGALRFLRTDGARSTRSTRLGSVFVVAQVTLAVVLLIGAGLLIRTLRNLAAVDPGFDPKGKVVGTVDFARQAVDRDTAMASFARITEILRRDPAVDSVALASTVPIQNAGMRNSIVVQGYTPPPGVYPSVDVAFVTPGFFSTLGVPLLRGRDFNEGDVEGAPQVVILNRAAVDAYWEGRDPIGEMVGDINSVVVGIVDDVRSRSLRDDSPPTAYAPFAQHGSRGMTILVKGTAPGSALKASLARAVREVDAELPIHQLWSLEEKVGYAMAQEQLLAGLLTAFAALGLIVAAGGLYSLVAYATQLRKKEFGIRLALGAPTSSVARSVLTQTLLLSAVGVLLGIPLAAFATRFLRTLLFDVEPLDPVTFGAVAAVLLAVGAMAGQLPARRAVRTDPATVLRHE